MSHDSDSGFTSPPLIVSTLDVHLKAQTRNGIESIVVNAGNTARQIQQAISPGGHHQELFDPPLEVLPNTKFSVSVRFRRATIRRSTSIFLDPKTISCEANEKDGKQVYCKIEGDIEVAIGIQSLPSVTNEVLGSCSRFRVLIIGESGVGKSSLMKGVFGISCVDVCDTTRGQANVDQEYAARNNDRFVVHDSCGFEAADHHNLEAACNFIAGRRCMRDLKDQLHAVWLCLEIPFAGGRLIEAGVEKFLKTKEKILGNIPLIVVFTKLDLLENMLSADALVEDKSLDENTLKKLKQKSLEESCLAPVRTATGNEYFPYVTVSTDKGYEGNCAALVEDTTRIIQKYIKDEAAHYVTTIARRVNTISGSH